MLPPCPPQLRDRAAYIKAGDAKMSDNFTLDGRLTLCAHYVRQGSRLADVGTDHAYLPVWLALNGRIRSAVACDIRQGPLDNARANIARCGVEGIVSAVLSDGLDAISPDLAEDIVIAGMGGELIAKIIQKPQWLRDGSRRLILQPMTRAETLRLFLCENGFCIDEEKACTSGKKYYSVMLCHYDGIIRECTDLFAYAGRLTDDTSHEAHCYLAIVRNKLAKKLLSYRDDMTGYEKLSAVITAIDSLISRPEGTKT